MYVDSHCHLTDKQLIPAAQSLLAAARLKGVVAVVTVGTDPTDSLRACALARAEDGVWAAIGLHPHSASAADEGQRAAITELCSRPEVVAIGETGLDYHYDFSPRATQLELFGWHIALAAERGLPLIVHSRAADPDTAAVLREAVGHVRGVLHCFTGGMPLLEAALDVGWFISFAGMATFRKYGDADLIRAVPADRLLIETDSPYLSPEPRRGKRNEPGNIVHVAAGVAGHRGEDPVALGALTARNAISFYGLDLGGAVLDLGAGLGPMS